MLGLLQISILHISPCQCIEPSMQTRLRSVAMESALKALTSSRYPARS